MVLRRFKVREHERGLVAELGFVVGSARAVGGTYLDEPAPRLRR